MGGITLHRGIEWGGAATYKLQKDARERLAAYEDTGLTPQEVMELLRSPEKAEKNSPLTLKELRKMDGEPVWCVLKGVHEEDAPLLETWFIVSVGDELDDDDKIPFWCRDAIGETLDYEDYGKDWLAYRRKLEEGAKCKARS